MSASAATRLRQLATQYHGGELDLHSYRRLRAELLDRLTNSDSEADEATTTLPQRLRTSASPAATSAATAPVAAAPSVAPAPLAQPSKSAPPISRPAAAPQPASVPAAPAPRKSGAGTFIAIALVVAVGIGAAAYFFLRPTAASPDATSEQVDTTSESYVAINDFVAADDWSDDQIANFNTRWTTMPEELRVAALDQPWYQNFVQRVRLRVKEQRALTATADSAGTVEGPLSVLASIVGIDVSSPDAVLPPRKEVMAADAGPASDKGASAAALAGKTKSAGKQPADLAAASAPAKSAAVTTVSNPGKPAAGTPRPAAAAAGAKAAAPQVVSETTNPDRCRIELVGSRKPRCRDVLSIGGFGPFLALIRADSFEMGSKQAANEQPVHRVSIAKPYGIAEFEASQAEYRLFCTETQRACEAQPWAGDDFPVVRVDWQDARDYVTWLSKVSGKNYRLATEAEWEFAARSGGSALYPSGEALSPTDAVFSQTDKLSAPWPRSRKINANTFRLYHSIGNVREWVEDAWSANFNGAPADGSAREAADTAQRVVRGGAYSDTTAKLRFTTREGLDPKTRDTLTGFRVVREL